MTVDLVLYMSSAALLVPLFLNFQGGGGASAPSFPSLQAPMAVKGFRSLLGCLLESFLESCRTQQYNTKAGTHYNTQEQTGVNKKGQIRIWIKAGRHYNTQEQTGVNNKNKGHNRCHSG